jgi:hypothetical protein
MKTLLARSISLDSAFNDFKYDFKWSENPYGKISAFLGLASIFCMILSSLDSLNLSSSRTSSSQLGTKNITAFL